MYDQARNNGQAMDLVPKALFDLRSIFAVRTVRFKAPARTILIRPRPEALRGQAPGRRRRDPRTGVRAVENRQGPLAVGRE